MKLFSPCVTVYLSFPLMNRLQVKIIEDQENWIQVEFQQLEISTVGLPLIVDNMPNHILTEKLYIVLTLLESFWNG